MAAEQSVSSVEKVIHVNNTRLTRVSHYLARLLEPYSVITDNNSEQRYRSKSGFNVYEEIDRLVATPSHKKKNELTKIVAVSCGFGYYDEGNWTHGVEVVRSIDGISERQYTEMARVIAQSDIPLRYSWSEQELLYEISLATGVTAPTLDAITAARFDANAAKRKYNGHNPLGGEYILLNVTAGEYKHARQYVTVHKEPNPTREGADDYKLFFLHDARTFDEALATYKHTIEYFNGVGAADEIQYGPTTEN